MQSPIERAGESSLPPRLLNMQNIAKSALDRNSEIYERARHCLASVDSLSHPLLTIRLARTIANFAEMNHTGRFADGAIDNRLLKIGEQLQPTSSQQSIDDFKVISGSDRSTRRLRIVHVTTSVHRIGGVSPLIANWIINDHTSQHTVAVTDQRGHDEQKGRLYPGFLESIRQNAGNLYVLPQHLDIRQRALITRAICNAHADLVLLHHFPADLIPILAFARRGGPPVAVVNASDHNFWPGSSIADSIINLRSVGQRCSLSRRLVKHNLILPIPLDDQKRSVTKEQARCDLGIPPAAVVLLSTGRGVKYQPYRDRDFMKTATRIVSSVPDAHLYIVGYAHSGPCHDQIHTLGSVDRPERYQAAADVYLEGFPIGSQTAVLESAMMGTAAVLAFDPIIDSLVTNDDAINDVLMRPDSEEEYVGQALRLVRDTDYRESMATALCRSVRRAHTGEGWRLQLADVYARLQALEHRPAPILETQCAHESVDTELASWNASMFSHWIEWKEWIDEKSYHYPPECGHIDHEFLLHNTLVDMERSGLHRESLSGFVRTLPLVTRKARSWKGIVRNLLALTGSSGQLRRI